MGVTNLKVSRTMVVQLACLWPETTVLVGVALYSPLKYHWSVYLIIAVPRRLSHVSIDSTIYAVSLIYHIV